MTFTFKLSRRLARLRATPLLAILVAALSCSGENLNEPGTPSNPTAITISPDSASVTVNGDTQFKADPLLEEALSPSRWKREKVSLAPKTATVGPGANQSFSATTASGSGRRLASKLTWTATGGQIDDAGRYTAGVRTGKYSVIVSTVWGTSDTAAVTITGTAPPPGTVSQVVLTPDTASLRPGGTISFSAVGKAADGSSMDITAGFSATGGSISAAGQYTAPSQTGNYKVIATDSGSGKADTSEVTVTSDAPVLAQIIVSPSTVSVAAGATSQFTSSGKASDGSAMPVSPAYTATGGTISSSGLFKAGPTAGTFRVIATQAGKSDTATVTVTPAEPTLASVVLTPATATVNPGANAKFAAIGRLPNGADTSITVTFTATGGSITSTGAYTAGSTLGSYRVIAKESGGMADTAAVTIAAPTVSTVAVSPASAAVVAGETTQLSATAKDAGGTVVEGLTFTWTSSNAGVASVNSSGMVTGTAAGNATITAAAGGKQGQASIVVSSPPISSADGCPASGYLRLVSVSTASQFTAAVAAAQPGDQIRLAAGTYGMGNWTPNPPGTAAAPITICGPRTAVLDFNGASGYLGGQYVRLQGFRMTDFGLSGFWLWGTHHTVLDNMEIDHAQQELLAVKNGAHHNTIEDSYFHDGGTAQRPAGEGIYVGGSMPSGGCCDVKTVGNQILRNRFERIWTEPLDIKDGSDSTLIQGNVIDGQGSQFLNFNAVSLIAINSNYNRIIGNTLSYGSPHGIAFFTVNVNGGTYQGSRGTLVQGNTIHLYDIHNYGGLGVKVSSGSTAIVKCDNVVTNLSSEGAAFNVPCTQ